MSKINQTQRIDRHTRDQGPRSGFMRRDSKTVFPLRKFCTEQMFVLLRKNPMQLRNHADTQTVKRS